MIEIERVKARFKVERKTETPFRGVSEHGFVGFVRGLDKAGGDITIINTIESESTEDYFIVDVVMDAENFKFSKGQAESYGVEVKEIERWNKEV